MAPKVIAQSKTVRERGPTVSMDQEAPNTPYRLTLPQLGRMPTSPQKAAGPRMEPPVSSPREVEHRKAAVAAPEPLLEVPGLRDRSQGLRGRPYGWWKASPLAYSLMFSLPSNTAPAFFKLAITVASSWGIKSLWMVEPLVVRIPRV